MSAKRLQAYVLLIMVAVIWGVAGSVIKFTLAGISPLPFLTYRFGISTLIAIFFFLAFKPKFPKKLGDFIELAVYGILVSTVSLGLLFWGVDNTTVLETEIITSIAPLMTSMIGVRFLHEHITKRERLGLGIALIGTLFIIFEPLVSNHGKGFHVYGNILVFLYVLANAISSLISKKLMRKGFSPAMLTNFGFIAGFLTIGAISLYKVGPTPIMESIVNLEFKYQLGVLFMAVISGTLAFTLVNKAQKTIEIGEVAVFSYLLPIFGIPTAVLWLGEKITLTLVIGAVITAIGVVVAEFRHGKLKK